MMRCPGENNFLNQSKKLVTMSLQNAAKVKKRRKDHAPAMKTPKRQPAKKTD
jgi:hypothetical protein